MAKQKTLEERRAYDRRRQAKSRAQRKAKELARKAQFGIETIKIEIAADDIQHIEKMCHRRSVGSDPYTVKEYIAELIVNDRLRYEQQVKELGTCEHCGALLPDGCNGLFEG